MKTNCAVGRGGRWVSAGCWKSLRCVKWLHHLTADCPGNNTVDFSLVFNVCVVSSASCWQLLSMSGRLISWDFGPSPLWAAWASPCFLVSNYEQPVWASYFSDGQWRKQGDDFPHKLLQSTFSLAVSKQSIMLGTEARVGTNLLIHHRVCSPDSCSGMCLHRDFQGSLKISIPLQT